VLRVGWFQERLSGPRTGALMEEARYEQKEHEGKIFRSRQSQQTGEL